MVYEFMPVANEKVSQRELVRTLVLQYGQKRASELSNVPYETVRKWTQRGEWLASQTVPNPVKTVADNVASELQENERETRLNLSRRHREHSSNPKLKPKEALQVAQGAQITHGWRNSEKDQANVAVNIAILSA